MYEPNRYYFLPDKIQHDAINNKKPSVVTRAKIGKRNKAECSDEFYHLLVHKTVKMTLFLLFTNLDNSVAASRSECNFTPADNQLDSSILKIYCIIAF